MVLLVGGSTRIPAVADKVRQLMGKEPSRNLNPDECVALGAAVQGGKLGNQLQAGSAASEIILMDVTPMSLSIETMGGIASRLIRKNTTFLQDTARYLLLPAISRHPLISRFFRVNESYKRQ